MSFANSRIGREARGLFYIHEDLHLPAPVPLTKVDLHVKVVDFVAEVQLTQEYRNRESMPIEAVYMFPVEEESAVVAFEASLDGRTIKTQVKEKEQARKEYQEAMAKEKTAFLIEEAKKDVFEIKVGQLKPGSRAKIVLKYISELKVDGVFIRGAIHQFILNVNI